jgi:hypothetical protein
MVYCDSARVAEGAVFFKGGVVVTFGVVLLILGFILGAPVLWSIGMLLVIIGLVFWILGSLGRAVGGRKHYY